MSNYAAQPHPNFFEFPQHHNADFSPMIYSHPANGTFLSTSPPPPSYQLCELVYTPVSTPSGVALTPSLVPMSPVDNQMYTPIPSPIPPAPVPNYGHPPRKAEEMARNDVFVNKPIQRTNNGNFINGIPVEHWKSMTDKEREEFLKAKRRQEAFKSALCQAFQRSGECRYGEACRFAHGKDELRLPKYNHPKYKTVLCRNYAVTGICPYGSRCQFIHEKFQGQIPEEYIVSVEVQANKPKPKQFKLRGPKSAQLMEGDQLNLIDQRSEKHVKKVREVKKELQANNELNYFTDLSDTFDKMFDAKKFFSRSCKPRIEM